MSTEKTNKDKTVTEEKQELRKFKYGGDPLSPDYNHPPERYTVTDVPGMPGYPVGPTPPGGTPIIPPIEEPTPTPGGPIHIPPPGGSTAYPTGPTLPSAQFGYTTVQPQPFRKGGVARPASSPAILRGGSRGGGLVKR